MNLYKTFDNKETFVYCLNILDDGRLAAGDSNSNLTIYNKDTFKADLIIQNDLDELWNFTQLKNKNFACSFAKDFTLKILKLKNKNNHEDIQIIQNAHNYNITKILELKNGNLITFSHDSSFKIWKWNKNYENIKTIKDLNELSDGLEIKENELLYAVKTKPQSLVFFDLNRYEKIKTINNLKLYINGVGFRIIKLTDDEIFVTGDKKIYLIDTIYYQILHDIDCDSCCYSILKLNYNLFLVGDESGSITQYKINDKKIIKESMKNEIHEKWISSIVMLDNIIITAGNNLIKFWKK